MDVSPPPGYGQAELKQFEDDLAAAKAATKDPRQLKRIAAIEAKHKIKTYHDFEGPSVSPKIELYTDLTNAGMNEMAEKVLDGQYDF